MIPSRIERMRRHPIIHGPQRAVFSIHPGMRDVGESLGIRLLLKRLEQVYGNRVQQVEVEIDDAKHPTTATITWSIR